MTRVTSQRSACGHRPQANAPFATRRPGCTGAAHNLLLKTHHIRSSPFLTLRYGGPHHVGLAEPISPAALSVAAATLPSAVQLVSAAAVPVVKVALFCAVGVWAANRGLLTPEGRRALSSLTLHVFTPCLLFSKLAVGVGLAEVGRMWVLSANVVASHVMGLLLGLLAVRLVNVPYRLRNQLVLSCGVGNVGNLPFVLLAGLAADPALPFSAALGPRMAGELAMSYVALSNLSAALIQFPLTYIFLQKPVMSSSSPPSLKSTSTSPLTSPLPPPSRVRSNDLGCRGHHSSSGSSSGSSSHACGSADDVAAGEAISGGGSSSSVGQNGSPESCHAAATNSTAPNTTTTPTTAHTSATGFTAAAAGATVTTEVTMTAAVAAATTTTVRSWRSIMEGILTPPTIFSLAAVVVASVGWLQDALFTPTGCLRLLGEISDALGAACIPVLLLVLGANLSSGPGVAAGRLPASCVVAAVATRLLLLPTVCGVALLGAWQGGLLPGVDPLAMLVMLVMHATPTAVLVHSMATIFGNAEDEVAAILFWQYMACIVTLPLAIGVMLQLLGPAATARDAWRGMAAVATTA